MFSCLKQIMIPLLSVSQAGAIPQRDSTKQHRTRQDGTTQYITEQRIIKHYILFLCAKRIITICFQ